MSHAVWTKLANMFAKPSQSHVLRMWECLIKPQESSLLQIISLILKLLSMNLHYLIFLLIMMVLYCILLMDYLLNWKIYRLQLGQEMTLFFLNNFLNNWLNMSPISNGRPSLMINLPLSYMLQLKLPAPIFSNNNDHLHLCIHLNIPHILVGPTTLTNLVVTKASADYALSRDTLLGIVLLSKNNGCTYHSETIIPIRLNHCHDTLNTLGLQPTRHSWFPINIGYQLMLVFRLQSISSHYKLRV